MIRPRWLSPRARGLLLQPLLIRQTHSCSASVISFLLCYGSGDTTPSAFHLVLIRRNPPLPFPSPPCPPFPSPIPTLPVHYLPFPPLSFSFLSCFPFPPFPFFPIFSFHSIRFTAMLFHALSTPFLLFPPLYLLSFLSPSFLTLLFLYFPLPCLAFPSIPFRFLPLIHLPTLSFPFSLLPLPLHSFLLSEASYLAPLSTLAWLTPCITSQHRQSPHPVRL